MRGLQCAKSLYFTLHHPEWEAAPTEQEKSAMADGLEVGLRAHTLFPGGILLPGNPGDPAKALEETRRAVASGASAVFEATVAHGSLLAKIDILHRTKNGWRLVEVKSSTSVKTKHLQDVAIQTHIARLAGYNIESAHVLHLNNQAIAPNLHDLFVDRDVTEAIAPFLEKLPEQLAAIQKSSEASQAPEIAIGPHCDSPYECPFKAQCWKVLPQPSIFDLPNMHSKAWDYLEKKITSPNDPAFGPFEGVEARRLEALRSAKRWVDKEGIAQDLREWRWPLLYLDFETLGQPVPQHAGTHAYQAVPFQFSALLQEAPEAPVQHWEYLHGDASDPRLPLLQALLPLLQEDRAVVAYYKGFEAACLEGMATAYPQYAEILRRAVRGLLDPLPIFRKRVYDPAFGSSFSIKKVGPGILGQHASYEGMPVADGTGAQLAFKRLVGKEAPLAEKAALRQSLLAYCKKDTQLMVDLVDWLWRAAHAKEAR
ncbi:DUF2779 domain-containing protein [bacterium]|nr:DUF2779 domain-containing protein [bacterium]